MGRRKSFGLWRLGGWAVVSVSAGFAVLLGLAALNIWTYQRLTTELDVATLEFRQLGDKYFDAAMLLPDGRRKVFRLHGDDWQLEVRMLKWQPWFTLLGKDPLYRLDRLRGRFDDIERARLERATVYQLSENPGIDLWALVRKHADWFPAVDAVYGSASYLPMADGARYRVTLGQSGLVARSMEQQAAGHQQSRY